MGYETLPLGFNVVHVVEGNHCEEMLVHQIPQSWTALFFGCLRCLNRRNRRNRSEESACLKSSGKMRDLNGFEPHKK